MFEHETDVRRITFGEFDLGAASKILKEARREAKAARERFWEYDDLIKKAESTVLYGCDADEFVQS